MAAAGPSTSVPVFHSQTCQLVKTAFLPLKPSYLTSPYSSLFLPCILRSKVESQCQCPTKKILTVCFVIEDKKNIAQVEDTSGSGDGGREEEGFGNVIIPTVMLGVTSMAIMLSVYYRFTLQMEGEEPMIEMLSTFTAFVCAAVGMEFWSRWVHKAIWHDLLRGIHESHHRRREGTFELNDAFAVANAIPAISLIDYGFFNKGLVPGICFGAGVGFTVIGLVYLFVHDGLVHKRFPVGVLADVPYFREVAAAHRIHHSEKFGGVPYGFFLGPKELEEVGGLEELHKEIDRMVKL